MELSRKIELKGIGARGSDGLGFKLHSPLPSSPSIQASNKGCTYLAQKGIPADFGSFANFD